MEAELDELSEDDACATSGGNEYDNRCSEGRMQNELRPLEFWTNPRMKPNYPRLSRMARDVFNIPSMSDEPERVFSSCGLMTTPIGEGLMATVLAWHSVSRAGFDKEL